MWRRDGPGLDTRPDTGRMLASDPGSPHKHRVNTAPAHKLRVLPGGRKLDRIRERDLVPRVEAAIESLQIVLQPIVWAQCPVVYGHEALVRTGSTSLGRPVELFAAAEQAGMVLPLERAIQRRVADAIEGLREDTLVFVNVHPAALDDHDLFDAHAPLAAHADRVAIEITERAALASIEHLPSKMAALRGLGFSIAIDGLGADYQGLRTFAEINPDVVKFDMSLVRRIDAQPVHAQLLRAMIAMSRDLGIRTVGVGVETDAERELLRTMGCDLLQGFRFARPDWPPAEIAW